MKVKQTAKKIVAVSASTVLAGATLMSALAAAPDLANYPSDFIVDGEFDGKIVVGAAAASQDIIGAIDIASSLQAASTSDVSIDGSTSTVIEGDAAKIGETSDILEIGEYVGDVVESLSDDDLAMLASGRVTTSKSSTGYSQTLELDGANTADNAKVILDENNDDETAYYLKFEDGSQIFAYELEFTSGLESDVDSNKAEDLEDEAIFMLGQYYSIVDSTVTDGEALNLELIAGDVTDTLEEGQTKTYSVDGVDYEVTVLVVGSSGTDSTVKFLVNGEVTDSLEEGDTDTLEDGLEIGVREVIETDRNFEGDTGSVVEFYLGANKIEFDVSASGTAGDVEIDRENIEDAEVTISYTASVASGTGDIKISNIRYTLDADADSGTDVYIAAGEGIREHLDEPEGMLNSEWDITFAGVSEPSMSEIEFRASGDEEYELTFTNRKGDEYSVPFVTTESGGSAFGFGDEDDQFVFWEQKAVSNETGTSDFNIAIDEYFLLTDDANTNQGDSYVYQWDDIDTDDNTLTFSNLATGDNKEVQYDPAEVLQTGLISVAALNTSNQAGDINIGGNDFGFWLYSADNVTFSLAIDLDNSGSIANGDTQVTVRGGGILDLYNGTYNGSAIVGNINLTLETDQEDVDNDVDQTVAFQISDDGTELDLALTGSVSGTYYEQNLKGEDREYAVTGYGAWFDVTDETDEADNLVIMYPSEQVEALVYVTGGDVQSSSVSTGSSAQKVNVLPVGIAVLDSEITNPDATNHIVVGGPCANTVAATLLGNPSDCAEGFQAGMGMIRSFDTGDHVAVLVAGFSARDTVESSRVLARAATEDVPSLEGDSVEVVIAGENDITVRAPVEAPAEEMADEEASEEEAPAEE